MSQLAYQCPQPDLPSLLTSYEDMCKTFDAEFIPGGATQNAMRVAQWVLKKPHSCAFIGCVGNDEYAR